MPAFFKNLKTETLFAPNTCFFVNRMGMVMKGLCGRTFTILHRIQAVQMVMQNRGRRDRGAARYGCQSPQRAPVSVLFSFNAIFYIIEPLCHNSSESLIYSKICVSYSLSAMAGSCFRKHLCCLWSSGHPFTWPSPTSPSPGHRMWGVFGLS